MQILWELSEEEKEDFNCEVVNCSNRAELYVTDNTEDGQGFICKSCNDEDELTHKGWEYPE